MATKEIVGRELVHFRRLRGLSQEALATAIGMSPCYLRNIERGNANPTMDVLIRIAAYLDVNLTIYFEENSITIMQKKGS